MDIGKVIDRHEKIALQFSGGKDSLVTLYLMQPWWDRLTVYWLNTGAVPLETVFQMAMLRKFLPRFVAIAGSSLQVVEEYGYPSDVVPSRYTHFSRIAAKQDKPFLIQDRNDCCMRSIMKPMHDRMLADGITLIIRGQRKEEIPRGPFNSGDCWEGIEFLYPIEDWTTLQVMAYLHENGIAVPNYYQYGDHGVDCLHCSAYGEKQPDRYLEALYPAMATERRRRIKWINAAVADELKESGHA